jgi:3-oxoadipate CoA-transferase beta subunit
VTRVYTDYAVFLIEPGGVRVRASYGMTAAELEDRLGLKLEVVS